MIPILFPSDATTYTSNGIGRLTEATKCTVTEERNGCYELEFSYPITGRLYGEIQKGRIIVATHDDTGDKQPFIIYRRSAPMNGIVTFNAHHLSYLLNHIILEPLTASSAASAFSLFETETVQANPFTFWTDVVTAGTFTLDTPASVRSVLGGSQGSILDIFGGEYEWTGTTVKLHAQRGQNSGVTIRYGKNLTDITQTIDADGKYNAVVPYWYGNTDNGDVLVALPEWYVAAQGVTSPVMVALDLTSEFQDPPTESQLRTKAQSYLAGNTPWNPTENIKINFVQLWQTEEFKSVAALQRLSLCDAVNVYHPGLGIVVNNVKIIKAVYNVLLDRYDSMELGEARSSLADTIISPLSAEIDAITKKAITRSYMQAAIDHATELLRGGLGGHVVIGTNASGEPNEILIMDTDDIDTAVHVLRINMNGIGFSSTGYAGTYTSAWTLDGQFVADFITAGTMSANRILGGTLKLGGLNNGNGVLQVYDASNNLIGEWDKDGADITGILTLLGDDILFTVGKKKQVVFYYSSGTPRYKNATAEAIRFEGYDSNDNLMATRNWGYAPDSNIFDMIIVPANTSPVGPQANRIIFFYKGASSINNISFNDMSESANYNRSGHAIFREEVNYDSASNVIQYKMLDSGTEIFKITKDEAQIGSVDSYGDGNSSYGSYMRTVATNGLIDIYACGSTTNTESRLVIARSRPLVNYKHIWLGLKDGPHIQIDADRGIYMSDSSSGGMDTSGASSISIHDGYITIRSRYNNEVDYTQLDLSPGQAYQKVSSSSRRYKHDIAPITAENLEPHRLYDLEVKQFRYNDDANVQYDDMRGQTLPGFIAEEVAEIYPAAVIRNQSGEVESWDERRIIPGMLALIQEQKQQIDNLQARIDRLEAALARLGV